MLNAYLPCQFFFYFDYITRETQINKKLEIWFCFISKNMNTAMMKKDYCNSLRFYKLEWFVLTQNECDVS